MIKTGWVCGQIHRDQNDTWSLVGVFQTEADAIAECKDETYFIGEIEIGAAMHDVVPLPGYYPKA